MANAVSNTFQIGGISRRKWIFTAAGNGAAWDTSAIGGSVRTVYACGTWGGGTITWEGSYDGVTWFTLTDGIGIAAGNALNMTTNKVRKVGEITQYIRPKLASGSGWALICVCDIIGGNAT